MLSTHRILGIHITDRVVKAGEVQQVLTAYGCNIKTRIGLHDVHEGFCSPNGLILLELTGDQKTCDAMIKHLRKIKGVQVKEITFDHPKPRAARKKAE
mgnify:CR=1 FL=1